MRYRKRVSDRGRPADDHDTQTREGKWSKHQPVHHLRSRDVGYAGADAIAALPTDAQDRPRQEAIISKVSVTTA